MRNIPILSFRGATNVATWESSDSEMRLRLDCHVTSFLAMTIGWDTHTRTNIPQLRQSRNITFCASKKISLALSANITATKSQYHYCKIKSTRKPSAFDLIKTDYFAFFSFLSRDLVKQRPKMICNNPSTAPARTTYSLVTNDL